MRNHRTLLAILLTLCLTTSWLRANNPSEASTQSSNLWTQNLLTGDWGGTRTKLTDKGVTFGFDITHDLLGNPSGGVNQATVNDGCIELFLDLDFEKLAGLKGSSFHANTYYTYGSDLSGSHIKNLMTVSNIEAYDTLRLFDLWYQQEFLDGKVSLRLGQLAADDEFLLSTYSAMLLNGTFGWPPLTAANLPSGGPGYPLATPGIRLRVNPINQLSLLAAVFDGDPGDRGVNPQKANSSGTNIDFNQGFFSIFEADYRLNQEKNAKGLPGTYRLGGFYATQNFSDVRTDDTGLSLANPASSGNPKAHSGDWGIYFIADQMVWREPAAADEPSDQGLGIFGRVGGAPSNRNLVDFYTDGGLNYKGLIPGRVSDVLGFGVAYAHISDDVSQLNRDTNTFTGIGAPIHTDEMAIELSYQAQICPWWTVQPDIQYIIHSGGNIPNPNDATGTTAIPNALVLGVRTTINF